MAKLSKYASFEALKSVEKSTKVSVDKGKALSAEYEAFLEMVRNKYTEDKLQGNKRGKRSV